MVRCPGQDQRFWKPEDIFEVECSSCGGGGEVFKDEPKLKCRHCGQFVVNPKIDLGCAEWCQYAEQCLGVSAVKNLRVMRDKLVNDMKKVFGSDQRRIDHALAVLGYAEQIQAVEGGDPLIIRAAAILHDIGILEAERKYNSTAGKYQEIEGPPIAREILSKYGLDEETIEHISNIVANHHSAKDIDTLEFKVIWDSDQIVNISAESAEISSEQLEHLLDKVFKTTRGRQIAIESFLETKTGKI